MKLRRASCLLCPRTAHSAPASHRSCSTRQTGTSRRSYGSRSSQPLFASLLRMWLECMPLSRVQLPRVRGLRHAPTFPDDRGTADRAGPAGRRSHGSRPRARVVRVCPTRRGGRARPPLDPWPDRPQQVRRRMLCQKMTETNATTNDTVIIRVPDGPEIRWRTQRMMSLGADAELAANIANSSADVHDIE